MRVIDRTFNPSNYPICFAYPLRIAASTWMSHVPFGMFLIEILKPRVVVELGTFRGVSYCAFCQAVTELGLDTHCYAIDTWHGDPQSGIYGPDVLADLRQHHDELYGNFSELIQSTFEEASRRFENESVDLLHIDGLHTYDSVKRDFETWLPKVSDKGVILFHDTFVKEADYGVWKFWEEIKELYPYFEFMHGYGLGLLAVGREYPDSLRLLLDASQEDRLNIQELFYQLGLRLEQHRSEHERNEQIISKQERKIRELESFVTRVRNNPLFKTYHWIKYLGRK
ncbi:MAG TPA: class I SAM-dependent methyltransferase [Pyrinomonadaceae bacterium]